MIYGDSDDDDDEENDIRGRAHLLDYCVDAFAWGGENEAKRKKEKGTRRRKKKAWHM